MIVYDVHAPPKRAASQKMAKKYIPVSGRAPPLTDSDQGALLDLSSDAEWPALSSSTENSAEASDLKFPSKYLKPQI